MNSWLLVFAGSTALAVMWSGWANAVKSNSAFAAAAWDVALIGTAGLLTLSFVHDLWLLIPNMAGGFVGTYAGVWWGGRRSY